MRGNGDKIAWARNHGCEWPSDACEKLAQHHDVRLLQHAVATGAHFRPMVVRKCLQIAALHGSTDTIAWLAQRGFVSERDIDLVHSLNSALGLNDGNSGAD